MKQSLQWCERIRSEPDAPSQFLFEAHQHLPFYEDLRRLAYNYLGHQLLENGYVVIRLFSPDQSEKLVKEFQTTELSFPEYRRHAPLGTKNNPYVLGGFGAYGNPASFHNPFVRKMRKEFIECVPIFGCMLREAKHRKQINSVDSYRVSLLFDRMCKRPVGTSTTRESYHRDLVPTARDSDITIGGWLQLSSDTSYLSCRPKTHSLGQISTKTKGFALEKNIQCTHDIPVPQGCMILFFQNLGHCVHATKKSTDSYRLFNVYLLTVHPTSIFDYSTIIDEQGVPRLPSNQTVPMYSANHASFWLDKLTIPWSKRNFVDAVLVTKEKKSDSSKYRIVQSPMKSLKFYHLPLYAPYKQWERELFVPQQIFTLPTNRQVRLFI